jgi:hypothetical protein
VQARLAQQDGTRTGLGRGVTVMIDRQTVCPGRLACQCHPFTKDRRHGFFERIRHLAWPALTFTNHLR